MKNAEIEMWFEKNKNLCSRCEWNYFDNPCIRYGRLGKSGSCPGFDPRGHEYRSTEALLARRAIAEKATPGPWIEAIEHEGDFDDDSTFITTEARREKSQLEIAKLESTEPYEYQLNALNLEQRANAAHIAANSPDVVTADIDEILRLRKEVKRLEKELKAAQDFASSQHEVAKLAWGGEIPSPLPGHPSMTEDEVCAMFEHLNCPWCGGSGHVGDCDEAAQRVKAKLEQLEKEANWLATAAANGGWHGMRVSPEYMRQVARKAVEVEEE